MPPARFGFLNRLTRGLRRDADGTPSLLWEVRWPLCVSAAMVVVMLAIVVLGDRFLTPTPVQAVPNRNAEADADSLRIDLWAKDRELQGVRRKLALTEAKLALWEIFGVLLPQRDFAPVGPGDLIPPQNVPTTPEE